MHRRRAEQRPEQQREDARERTADVSEGRALEELGRERGRHQGQRHGEARTERGPAREVSAAAQPGAPGAGVGHRVGEGATSHEAQEPEPDGRGEDEREHSGGGAPGRPGGRVGCRRSGWCRARSGPSRSSSGAARRTGPARARSQRILAGWLSTRWLLNPSPSRNRTNESTKSRVTLTWRFICQTSAASSSSPSVSVVAGTVRAVVVAGVQVSPRGATLGSEGVWQIDARGTPAKNRERHGLDRAHRLAADQAGA